jgi:HEPN domain-containing protein
LNPAIASDRVIKMPEFDKKKTIAYWMSSSRYDMSVANALMKSRKYPYALFMGHLSLEKLLKALVVKMTDEHAPFSHSLPYLAEKSGVDLPQPIHIKLREVMEFHFEGRYPDAHKAFYRKCTRAYTAVRLKEIKEIYKWVKEKL